MQENLNWLLSLVADYDSLWVQIAISVLIVLMALLVKNIFTRIIFGVVLRLAYKTKTDFDRLLVIAFEGPVRSLLVVIGVYIALQCLPLSLTVMSIASNLFRSAIIIYITLGFYNLAGGDILKELSEKLNLEQSVIGFTAKMLRFIIVALSITVIAQEWDYDISGFVAGLGLGGLAFALAARDTASNIFGGIAIILDKPFTVGDWILTPSVEGTVEDMSLRTTKVRTFANALVTVPNSVLVNEAVTNWSRMQKRQIFFHLGVAYTTPRAKLQECVDRIRAFLQAHPEVHPDVIFANFEHFNDSSLDIIIYFFTKTKVWGEYLAIREEINFKIMEILEEEGVSIAFPSRSVYFENKLKSELDQHDSQPF